MFQIAIKGLKGGSSRLPNPIPEGIGREHILSAISDLRAGVRHGFGPSAFYDVLHNGERFPPKAVFGLAAGKVSGTPLVHSDFKGGLKTICIRTLQENGFVIVSKPNAQPFPEEIDPDEQYFEGAVIQVIVNRFERDPKARAKSIAHHGPVCLVCNFDFEKVYGPIGAGFIHIHHVVPISEIRAAYVVDPIRDLKPVCPNCHAMLHRSNPPRSIEALRNLKQKHRV